MTGAVRPPGDRRPAVTCRGAALAALARRAHTRVELASKLRRKGFGAEEISATLDQIAESGYLDDARTAASFARSRSSRVGRARIASELAARGVSRDDASAALAEIDPSEESQRLLVALERKSRTLSTGLTAAARSKKLFDHLVRRGFAPGAVLEVLRKKGEPAHDDE